ncbi:Lipopolysaccharide assembly protein LapB [hydrothermal vent metagenome]|uniref:Lipopolysaccharide assembly protein LapB n=1 Tax=hydrothermal vent metagenome TaxID=652676 RepID=A0A3B0Y8K1_9ZZZZ
MQALFWLLLPVAAASGWWMAIYSQRKQQRRSKAELNSAYGQGLNYLLNEQPDKATEVLVQMVEVDPDTVELHLALGSLFRRRGEVDRAIRVHRNIIARSALSETLRSQATLELGRDFLKAGLLDRAEQLFQQLLDARRYDDEARKHLIDLYQQEKEWGKAAELVRVYSERGDVIWRSRLAQYLCALGEAALARGNTVRAESYAGDALSEDADCVRATLLKGECLRAAGKLGDAVEMFQQVEFQCAELLPEVLGQIRDGLLELGRASDWTAYVDELAGRHSWLLFYRKNVVDQNATQAVVPQSRYRCQQCGFTSRKLFWQCPGCQCWSSVKPIKTGTIE